MPLIAACAAIPLVAGLTAATPEPAAAAELTPDPLVLYTFDGDPSAATIANEGTLGSAFDARVRNAPALQRGTGPTSEAGSSGLFPGGPQGTPSSAAPYLDIPPGLFAGMDAMTVSTWIKWDGRNAGQLPWAYIIGSDALPADNWGLYFIPNEGGQSKAAANSGTEVKSVSPAPLSTSVWTQITSVADGETLSYYINGQLVRTESVQVDFAKLSNPSSTRSGLIGRVPWAPQWASLFGGEFDDFAVYDAALTGAQVQATFSATAGDIVSVERTEWAIDTTAGIAPTLPTRVRVSYEAGLSLDAAIQWEPVRASQYAQAGSVFTVAGTVAGSEEDLTATVRVAERQLEDVSVDFAQRTGDFRGGASGTLYGLGDEQSPTQALVNGSAMNNISQKPPFGTQHPGGDAFNIESTFFDKYGKDLYIYTQDYYPDWPYNRGVRPGDDRTYVRDNDGVLTSEWTAGGNGVWDYLEVLEIVTEAVATGAENPERYIFIPFNEVDLQWLNSDSLYDRFMHRGNQSNSFTPDGATDWVAAWNVITDVYARHGLERPLIAGPGDAAWRGEGNIKAFLDMAIRTDTVPDIYVWHELRGYQWMPDRVGQFERYAREMGISEDEMPEINITEYGASTDMSSPANLLRWFASFEAAKVDAQTAYWTASGTMSDNQAKVNAANGGWWLFKWYGDMVGSETATVTTNREKAIAAIDDDNARAQIIVAGIREGRDGLLKVTGLPEAAFGSAVDIEVREAMVTGTDGVADTPPVVAAYDGAAVTGGAVDVRVPSSNASSAYQVVITPASDREVERAAEAQPTRMIAEAETLDLTGATPRTQPSGGYRLSGERDVTGFTTAGSRMDWEVSIDQPGLYRYTVLGATPGRAAQHAVFVDDEFADIVQYGANAVRPGNVRTTARGTAEVYLPLTEGAHTLSLRTSRDGETLLPGAGLDGGVSLDRVELLRVGDDVNALRTDYPATTFRYFGEASLTDGQASLEPGGRVDLYPSAYESGYYDIVVDWTGSDLQLTVNGREATSFTSGQIRARIHLPEGITELELTSREGSVVSNVSTTRAVAGDASIVRINAADSSVVSLTGSAVVKSFGDALTNGSGGGYVGGLGITDANAENEGRMTIARLPGFDTAGSYNAIVHYSNDDIEGTHDYNPQVVDLGLQATEGQGANLVGRSTFRYTYTATNFWEAVMPLDLTTADQPLTFGNTKPTLVIDERSGQQDQVVLDGYAIAPDVDWIAFAPLVLETDGSEASVPDAPAAPTATVDGSSVTVAWEAPADNGSEITSYVLDFSSEQARGSYSVTVTDGLSATVGELGKGTWTVRVTAVNGVGSSPGSAASEPFTIEGEDDGGTDGGGTDGGEPTPTPTPTGGSMTQPGGGTSAGGSDDDGPLAVTGSSLPIALLLTLGAAAATVGAALQVRKRRRASGVDATTS